MVGAAHVEVIKLGIHWFLPVDLADEGLHTLGHARTDLRGHLGNDVYDLLLPLLGFVVRLDHVQVVEVLRGLSCDNTGLLIELLPLHRRLQLLFEERRMLEHVVSPEGVYRELTLKCVLVLIHLQGDSFAELAPLLLVFAVPCFKALVLLLEHLALFFDHIKLLPEFQTLVFLLLHILIELVDLLLQVADLDFESFFLVLELLLHFEYLDVDHLVLLDFGNQLFLSQLQILIDLLQFFLDLHDLLGAIAGKEASTEVTRVRLLVLRILLPLILKLLQNLDSLRQSLIVEL